MQKRSFGYCKSKLTGNEQEFKVDLQDGLPKEYVVPFDVPVVDQGSHGSCVSCSAYDMLSRWMQRAHKQLDKKFDWLYQLREDKRIDGMTPLEAFNIMLQEHLIDNFARIGALPALKSSIVINGSAMICLPVYDTESVQFWKEHYNRATIIGGHAVAVIGYDADGLILKNSWGKGYGHNGIALMPYEDFGNAYELWTII